MERWESKEFGASPDKKHPNKISVKVAQVALRKIRASMGLDRVKAAFTTGDHIDAETLRFFFSIDLPVLDVYGQSECSGPHCVSTRKVFRIGSVGRPIPGTASKIDPSTGELWYSGRHVCAGYLNMKEKTAMTIDDEGFLHSGDLAEVSRSFIHFFYLWCWFGFVGWRHHTTTIAARRRRRRGLCACVFVLIDELKNESFLLLLLFVVFVVVT